MSSKHLRLPIFFALNGHYFLIKIQFSFSSPLTPFLRVNIFYFAFRHLFSILLFPNCDSKFLEPFNRYFPSDALHTNYLSFSGSEEFFVLIFSFDKQIPTEYQNEYIDVIYILTFCVNNLSFISHLGLNDCIGEKLTVIEHRFKLS